MEPKPYLETRFQGRAAKRASGDHWIGGKPVQRNAICPSCKIPLLLLWDINCRDPRFPAGAFGALERLPLYYCWSCISDLGYRIVSDTQVDLFPICLREGPNYLYAQYPKQFKRRPLDLSPKVPEHVRTILKKWDRRKDLAGDSVSAGDKYKLARFFCHPVKALCYSLFHHQFGGIPVYLHWAMEVMRCPNPACPGRNKRKPDAHTGRAMRFLAGLLNDPRGGLPMVEKLTRETTKDWNYFVTVQFHICDRCLTITACNRSD